MYGDYTVDNGIYDFKYGGFINKPFIIQKGGTISWEGSPYNANLDLVAIYKAKANPGVLSGNFNFNRNIDVDLITKITGKLFNSKRDLDIKLINVDPSIANELEFVLTNRNQKNIQFVSLLAFGNFTNNNRGVFDTNATLTSTVASAFSSFLNNSDSKLQLGVDYKSAEINRDLNQIITDNQLGVSLNAKLNERLIINGKLGVPVGANTESSVIGEVQIEVMLNKKGNF